MRKDIIRLIHELENDNLVSPKFILNRLKEILASDNLVTPRLLGTKNAQSKLTDAEVRRIKRYLAKGYTITKLCEIFNMSRTAISSIKLGYTWSHISVNPPIKRIPETFTQKSGNQK